MIFVSVKGVEPRTPLKNAAVNLHAPQKSYYTFRLIITFLNIFVLVIQFSRIERSFFASRQDIVNPLVFYSTFIH